MNYTLKYLEERKEEERKKYCLSEQEIIAWRNKIKKVSINEANTIAFGLFNIIKDEDFDDENDSMLTSIKYLIESGANINYKDKHGQSLLSYSVHHQYINVSSILLSYGANPNITERNGLTPVGIACRNDDEEMLKLLIYNGADINQRFANGETAINEIITRTGFVNSPECLDILLKHNVIINNTDLCNNSLRDIQGIQEYFNVNFQEKRQREIDYEKLIQEAKSHLQNGEEEEKVEVKKEPNKSFKRIR